MTSDERYLDLLIKTLTNQIYLEHEHLIPNGAYYAGRSDEERLSYRKLGMDLPRFAHTMVGEVRLQEIQRLTRVIRQNGIDGDFIDCGVWRGGTSIFMRACMDVYGMDGRALFVADSFEGLPPPDDTCPEDKEDKHHEQDYLAVSSDEVARNFHRYGFGPDSAGCGDWPDFVYPLEGFFEETMPDAANGTDAYSIHEDRLALIRIDADMYSSTTHCLEALYPFLEPGGIVIVDDYETLPACKKAVDDFREKAGITADIETMTNNSGFWVKSTPVELPSP